MAVSRTLQETLNGDRERFVAAQHFAPSLTTLSAPVVEATAFYGAIETPYFSFVAAIRIEEDPHAWLVDQVKLLRSRQGQLLDWDELAEELEAMANRDKTEVISHLRDILANFLKLAYSARRRSEQSWKGTILRARLDLSLRIDNSRTLRNELPAFMVTAYKQARALATHEMRLEKHQAQNMFPEECGWSIEQIQDEEFFPEIAATANGRPR